MSFARYMRSVNIRSWCIPVPRAGLAQRSRLYHRPRSAPTTPRLTPTALIPRISPQIRARPASQVPFSPSRDIADPSQSSEPYRADRAPSYQLTFTCKPCSHRSSHTISKQGYHNGTVLITCPSCKNRHIISDHLRVFVDEKYTLEDILQRKAAPGTPLNKLLKKGKLGVRQGAMVGNEGEEDIEFWDDGTQTPHGRKKDK